MLPSPQSQCHSPFILVLPGYPASLSISQESGDYRFSWHFHIWGEGLVWQNKLKQDLLLGEPNGGQYQQQIGSPQLNATIWGKTKSGGLRNTLGTSVLGFLILIRRRWRFVFKLLSKTHSQTQRITVHFIYLARMKDSIGTAHLKTCGFGAWVYLNQPFSKGSGDHHEWINKLSSKGNLSSFT